MPKLSLLLSLSLSLALVACEEADDHGDHDQPVDADVTAPDAAPADAQLPSSVETRSFTLAPGVFAEGTFAAGAGDRVVVELTAAGPVIAWNLHGHVGGNTQIIEEGDDQTTVTFEFTPAAAGEWFIMFGNSGAEAQPIDATLSFYGAATFTEWL